MPALGFSLDKSLQELEGQIWSKSDVTDTGLVKKCHRLHQVPLKDFTPADLRVMIGQQIGLDFLVPLALQHLDRDPLIECNYYPGDLLANVLAIEPEFWRKNLDFRIRAQHVAETAIASFPLRTDVAGKTTTRTVKRAFTEFQGQT